MRDLKKLFTAINIEYTKVVCKTSFRKKMFIVAKGRTFAERVKHA
jgi:hypothetical protein